MCQGNYLRAAPACKWVKGGGSPVLSLPCNMSAISSYRSRPALEHSDSVQGSVQATQMIRVAMELRKESQVAAPFKSGACRLSR